MNPRQAGRFAIDCDLIYRTPQAVQAVMAQCIVVRAEMMFARNQIEYTAIGDAFQPVDAGQMTPLYVVTINDLIGGKYHITWTEQHGR